MSANGKGRVNILLVDDQPAKLLSYETILNELGENLVKAGSAREALDKLLRDDFAVVLVDVCMPEMDGFELAALIREHPRYRKTAIILVSAVYLSDFDRLRGYDCGAVDYIPVPIIPEVLRAKVSVFADLYRKKDELLRLNSELEQRVAERTASLEAYAARLRDSEERLQIALSTGRLGAWELDAAGGRMEATPLCKEILGLDADVELDLDTFCNLIHPQDRPRVHGALEQAVQQRREFETECRCVWPDGSLRWIVVRARAVSDQDAPPRIIGVNLDITQRKLAEEERALLLESERAARLEAESADRAKDEFLATLSHEMRTPLNAIVGWVQLLRRNICDAGMLARGLETIERNSRAQSRLIEDLFDISRVTSGKMRLNLATVELPPLIDSAIETIRPMADAKAIEIIRDFDLRVGPVEGDAVRLEQVMFNLLSNAVKFTPSRGKVWVRVERSGLQIVIQVTDNGEGIAPEFLPYVFERFRQADSSRSRKYGGLGLGLSIARHLVELHGGSIAADSAGKDQGVTFTVRLQAAAPCDDTPELLPPLRRTAPSLAGVRVLVVDDDPDACELMRLMLTEYDAVVETTHCTESVIRKLMSSPPDVLVSDIGMPGKDGYELIREIRELSAAARSMPAVALTGYARPEDCLHALKAGYDRHVSKPVNPAELVSVISSLLQTPAVRA